MAGFLNRLTVLFVAVWAIRSLIVMGSATMNEHYRTVLKTPPSVTQSMVGTSFDQSLLKIDRAIPPTARVAVIWSEPAPGYSTAFFWSTYYLYPRRVVLGLLNDPKIDYGEDVIIFVRGPGLPPPAPEGFRTVSTDAYPDAIVTTYRRDSG